jgi:hypothetical protein
VTFDPKLKEAAEEIKIILKKYDCNGVAEKMGMPYSTDIDLPGGSAMKPLNEWIARGSRPDEFSHYKKLEFEAQDRYIERNASAIERQILLLQEKERSRLRKWQWLGAVAAALLIGRLIYESLP